jgi:hypothetical protein
MESFLDDIKSLINNFCNDIDNKYIKRKRKISGFTFFSLLNRFGNNKSYNLIISDEDIRITKSSFCEFRNKIPYQEIQILYSKTIDIIKKHNLIDQCIYAVDGSKMLLDKRLNRNKYKTHKNIYFVQGLISTVFDVNSLIPIDINLGPDKDERSRLLSQISSLQKNSILIADRGYMSFELFEQLIALGIHPIFRLRENLQIVKNIKSNDCIMQLTKDKKSIPIRVIKYVINGLSYYIGTDLFDKERYPIDYFKKIYWSRWSIEEFYKFLKGTCDLSNFRSKSENGIKQELYLYSFQISIMRAIELLNNNKLPANTNKKTKFNSKVIYNIIKTHIIKIINMKTGIKKLINKINKYIPLNIIKFERDRSFKRNIKRPTTKEKYNNIAKLKKK